MESCKALYNDKNRYTFENMQVSVSSNGKKLSSMYKDMPAYFLSNSVQNKPMFIFFILLCFYCARIASKQLGEIF